MPAPKHPCLLCSCNPFDSQRALRIHQAIKHGGAQNSSTIGISRSLLRVLPQRRKAPARTSNPKETEMELWGAIFRRSRKKPVQKEDTVATPANANDRDDFRKCRSSEETFDMPLDCESGETEPPLHPLASGTRTSSDSESNAIQATPLAPLSTPTGRPSAPVPLQDVLPNREADALLEEVPEEKEDNTSQPAKLQRLHLFLGHWRTKVNAFGVFREFVGRSKFPSPSDSPSKSAGQPTTAQASNSKQHSSAELLQEALGPFPNYSTFKYAQWFLESSSGQTSAALSNDFTKNVITDPLWCSEDVAGLDLNVLKERIAAWNPVPFDPKDGWQQKDVFIEVPLGGQRGTSAKSTPYHAGVLNCRSVVDIVRQTVATDPNVKDFFLHPFTEYQRMEDGSKLRLIRETASADRFRDHYNEVQKLPKIDGCNLERIVFGLMFWSDSTHLAQFGSHKLWPIYMAFANQPRWQRHLFKMGSWHDVAHIPSLPKTFQDFIREHRPKGADKTLITHCRRELFHAVWEQILDPEFVDAYENGIVLEFPSDGKKRRVFLRLLSYSADYPEKVLIAAIRDLGNCPCPRCLVTLKMVRELGTVGDRIVRTSFRRRDDTNHSNLISAARHRIYELCYAVKSKCVEKLLQPTSIVPTKNAFSKFSGPVFDIHSIMVVDLMHEFELGVWKAVLEQLIRMLHFLGADYVQQMDNRYRLMTPFGKDTIRVISYNVSELGQLAARDYEDLLQCSVPVFEGLFPDPTHDKDIVDLLYTLTDWHALAKLTLHSEKTLDHLDLATSLLGQQLRHFSGVTCKDFRTMETEREFAKRRRKAANANQAIPKVRAARGFNLETYKLHALGDYTDHFRSFGSSENYSTQSAESRHTKKKIQYRLTNKNRFEAQIAQRTVISENISIVANRVASVVSPVPRISKSKKRKKRSPPSAPELPHSFPRHSEPVDQSLHVRYDVANDRTHFLTLGDFLNRYKKDLALKDFRLGLLDHVVSRLQKKAYSWDRRIHKHDDYSNMVFDRHRLYFHRTLRINFTTYDMLLRQDTIKPFLAVTKHSVTPLHLQRCFIMLAASEDDRGRAGHRFWYAQVLAILHVKARNRAAGPTVFKRINILWVRWMGPDYNSPAGLQARRLDKVGFLESDAFGFVNPSDVIRASHMIPFFGENRTAELLGGNSMVQDPEHDWSFYQVNRHVDRDMYMRYLGGGVGHVDPAQHAAAEDHPVLPASNSSLPTNREVIASMIPREGSIDPEEGLEFHEELVREEGSIDDAAESNQSAASEAEDAADAEKQQDWDQWDEVSAGSVNGLEWREAIGSDSDAEDEVDGQMEE